MLPLTLPYLVLAAFFIVELILRKDGYAKSLGKTKSDRNSTSLITIAIFTVVGLSIIFNYLKSGVFESRIIREVALVIMVFGLFLRVWSMITLKRYYTRTLITTKQQTIIKKGPYSIIRHPGYLGTILVWSFAGLAMQNIIIPIVSTLLIVASYVYRINKEEKMLAEQFGKQYIDYKFNTWRLIPFIW